MFNLSWRMPVGVLLMPIYEYQCDACGHEMEKLQKLSDPAITECPQCKKSTLKKLISAAGFRLKGTGWYETDFKNKSQKKEKSDKPSDKPKDAKKSEKSETKTESKGKAASSGN